MYSSAAFVLIALSTDSAIRTTEFLFVLELRTFTGIEAIATNSIGRSKQFPGLLVLSQPLFELRDRRDTWKESVRRVFLRQATFTRAHVLFLLVCPRVKRRSARSPPFSFTDRTRL